jgi:hypothetical protein
VRLRARNAGAEMIGLEETAEEVIEDLLFQFAYRGVKDGRLVLTTGGLSALEGGFAWLGWDDPKPIPEFECQAEGCHKDATTGRPTPEGYKRLCFEHFKAEPA